MRSSMSPTRQAHHHDGIGGHRRRIRHHAVDRMTSRFLQQLRVLGDRAACQRPQTGHDVAAQPSAAHYHAEDLALDLAHVLSRHVLSCHHEHRVECGLARITMLAHLNVSVVLRFGLVRRGLASTVSATARRESSAVPIASTTQVRSKGVPPALERMQRSMNGS